MKDRLAAKCKYFHLLLDWRKMVLVKNKLKTNKQTNKTNIFKTNIFV